MARAKDAYQGDRYAEAARLLKSILESVPDSPAARELYGLTLYRQGRWALAIAQLDTHHKLTHSYDQYPVLEDCHRAMRHHRQVEALWSELRDASPGGDVVAEGRIVAAGALADRGDLAGAIAMLRQAAKSAKRGKTHHARTWYALADLYERSGDLPRARQLFDKVARQEPELSDAAERLNALT